jgi:hypothetical protein
MELIIMTRVEIETILEPPEKISNSEVYAYVRSSSN